MFKSIRSLFSGLVMVAVLGLAAFAGWRWGDPVFSRVAPSEVDQPRPSRELSDSTLARFEALRRGEAGDRLVLGSLELESVLRYGVPQMMPVGVTDQALTMKDGAVEVSGDVAVASFPDLPDLGGVIGILPDTVRIDIEGTLTPFDARRSALVVHQVRALGIPLPDRMIADILKAMGRDEVRGLDKDALAVPLPNGIEAAYILRDSLVLVHGG